MHSATVEKQVRYLLRITVCILAFINGDGRYDPKVAFSQ